MICRGGFHRSSLGGQTRGEFVGRAAPVQFDDFAGGVREDQHGQWRRLVRRSVDSGLGYGRDLPERTGGNAAAACKGGAWGV